jgi:lipid A 3-O-deacylase
MNNPFLKRLIGCFLVAGCAQSDAGTLDSVLNDFQIARTQGKATTLLNIDNDTLLFNKNDGFYSSGVRIEQQYAMRGAKQATLFGWRFGQDLFTASDIKLPPELIRSLDHPYAAWLYGGFFKETRHDDGTHSRTGIDIGCLGPCAGGDWTQTNLHRLLRQPLPQGWSKQMKNEAGVMLYAESAPVRWVIGRTLDITPNLHARFGNIYTDAGAGITLRAGQLASAPEHSALHGFVRADVTAVGYNATLQGGYFSNDNPHTVKPKRLVGEAEIGMAWKKGPYQLSASLVRRGNEIRGLSNTIGAQNFARLLFTYSP